MNLYWVIESFDIPNQTYTRLVCPRSRLAAKSGMPHDRLNLARTQVYINFVPHFLWLILSRDPSGHALIAWLRRHRTSVHVIFLWIIIFRNRRQFRLWFKP